MKIGSLNIDFLIKEEVNKAIKEILESNLSIDSDGIENKERSQQKKVANQIKKRGLSSSDSKEEVVEAEDEESDNDNPEESEPRKDRTGGKGTAQSRKILAPSEDILNDPKINSFIDKLNILRGGKSLKDPAIKKSLDQYLRSLNVKEKKTLLIFLTGLAQIMAGTKQGAEAIDPNEVGLTVHSNEKEKKPITAPQSAASKSRPSGTETAPIVVGESQKKLRLKNIFEEYKKCR